MTHIRTIDAEVAGEAVRLIVGGSPSVPGRTMADKLKWLRRHGDALRRLLMLEPRGHAGMHGAMLTEPASQALRPGSGQAHAGLLSMHAAGFPLVSGEGIVAAVTIALEHRLIEGVENEVFLETPVGLFSTSPRSMDGRITSVAVTGVPSFVHSAGVVLKIGSRHITVDIAFGGQFYAIADSEAIGIPIDIANAGSLIRMGREISEAIASTVHVQHPIDSWLKDVHGTIFTGAARGPSDLRSATVIGGEVLRRSPGVTGTAAVMAVLDAMGLLTDEGGFTHEGVLGTTLHGRVARRHRMCETATIIPVIEASASITGFHEFVNG